MCYLNYMIRTENYSFLETFSLKKGLKQFGTKGYDAAFGEIKQLHDRVAFKASAYSRNDATRKETSNGESHFFG